MSELTIKVKARCVEPTLNSVVKINATTVSFSWNNNAVVYTSGNILLEMSSDNGSTWNTLVSIPYNLTNYTISNPVFNNLSNGQTVKFRITINGIPCSNMISNIITQTWVKQSTIYTSNVINDNSAGSCVYKLHVEGVDFIGYVNVLARKPLTSKNARINPSPFGVPLNIPNGTPDMQDVFNSTAVTIPIGVYNCYIYASAAPVSINDEATSEGGVSYGYDMDYHNGLANAQVLVLIPPNSEPQV